MRIGWAWALLACAAACATAGPGSQPASADAHRFVASADHLVGVGEGPTMELARRRAAAEIASQLGGRLRAEGWVQAESERSGDKSIERERIGEHIQVETDFARMEWVEVVSARTRGEMVEVVAVLDRRKAARRLRAELDERAEGLRAGLDRARQNAGLLAQAQALQLLEQEREAIESARRLLAALSPGEAWAPPVLAEMDRERDALHARLRAIEWEICLAAEEGADLAALFAGRLAERGIDAKSCGAPEGERARLRLRGELDATVQRMDHPGGYPFFCTTRLRYRIEGGEASLEAGGVAEGLRSGAHAATDACARSVGELVDDFLQRIGWLR